MKRPNLLVSAILISAFAVTACTPYWAKDREVKFVKCPTVQLLAPARGWIDPPGDAWTARGEITEFATECKITKTAAEIKITATVQMERRNNIDQEVKMGFPMFMVVTRGDDIISKQTVLAPLKFAEGKAKLETQIEMPIALDLVKPPEAEPLPDAATPAPDDKDKAAKKDEKPKDTRTAADRMVTIGFQLTPEQLAYFAKLRDAPAAAVQAK